MTSKAEELKALEQIKKIVEGIGGADSYVGQAFSGCFEIAQDNIENDFWNSMKDNYDRADKEAWDAQKKAKELSEKVAEMEKRAERAENLYNSTQGTADQWCARYHEAADMAKENWNKFREQEDKVEALQQEIIRLKARLFDMMEAQGA